MEPSTEFKNGSTKKRPQRKESSSDQLLSDTQEKMEHMEITSQPDETERENSLRKVMTVKNKETKFKTWKTKSPLK